ncbi:hypothetical protein BJ138DRAFT_1117787 [Hygrophoropsis aurantiaca]|uniref:Uncharacterized protein n=1 Tax=Hygrophoropsis aurantiaca TaxID=72124 RepID=A0ACB7ZZN7_9AGAM|nr:hypothetical protein BJ138DRAFT_1117787 [Hygrophoropsis aurantiaca]
MSAEKVPYQDGMQEGQGFNTYTQETCLNGAVIVTKPPSHTTPYTRDYNSELIEDYEKLATSLDISAGATVSGWGQSGQVNAEFMSRSEVGTTVDIAKLAVADLLFSPFTQFESSDVTYLVKVNVQHQPTHDGEYSFHWVTPDDPNKTYGDRYISGECPRPDFVKGGYYYARISIRSINRSESQEIKQSAKVAFTMYGATGEVTEAVKSAVEKIQKHSEVRISKMESGGGNKLLAAQDSMLSLKEEADQFYKDAEKHNYLRYAILSKYENLKDFNNAFKPFDYVYASKKSWKLFDEFTAYTTFETLVKDIPDGKYTGGSSQKTGFRNQQVDEMNKIRQTVHLVRDDPSKVDDPPTYMLSNEFYTNVLVAVKTVTYIAQSIELSSGNWSDVALPSLKPGASKLFDFTCYDFANVQGTTVVSFGSGNDGYIALFGTRASDYPGWKEDSCFWVFEGMVPRISEAQIDVSRASTGNYIRLSRDNRAKMLFSFHAGKV